MAKDPICGMEVNEDTAIKLTLDDKSFYFCSEPCKTIFESQPEKYRGKQPPLKNYLTEYERLQTLMDRLKAELPDQMRGFDALHRTATGAGVLEKKVKEMMALVASIVLRCDECVAYHVRDALASGATREEVLEAIGVAIFVGGSPAAIHAAQAVEALSQMSVLETYWKNHRQ